MKTEKISHHKSENSFMWKWNTYLSVKSNWNSKTYLTEAIKAVDSGNNMQALKQVDLAGDQLDIVRNWVCIRLWRPRWRRRRRRNRWECRWNRLRRQKWWRYAPIF